MAGHPERSAAAPEGGQAGRTAEAAARGERELRALLDLTALHLGHSPLVATRGGACWGCGPASTAQARSELGVNRRAVVCPHGTRLPCAPRWLEGL